MNSNSMEQDFRSRRSSSNDEHAFLQEVQTPLLHQRPRNSRSTALIYGFVCLESIAYGGVAVNLVVYLSTVLNENNTATVAKVSVWNGTSLFMPLIGALIADSYLGNYRTILISGLLYIPGMVMVTISALSSSVGPANKLLFFCGLYLVAAGSGGIKAALIPHSMEQLDGDEGLAVGLRKAEFFNRFYVCLAFGFLASRTIIVWIQVRVSWALGFGLSTICVILALILFVAGAPSYRVVKPGGSPLKSLLQVMVASVKKIDAEPPADDRLLYEVDDDDSRKQRLAHTEEFKFLDKAATTTNSDLQSSHPHDPWILSTVTQVEELKVLLRLLPIWSTVIIFNAGYSQLYTTFIEQARDMNTTLFPGFSVPPASLSSLEVIFVMAWAFTFRRLNNTAGFSLLRRIGIGKLLMVLTMASAAAVEAERLRVRRLGEDISIAWQIPCHFLLGGAEMFCNVGQLELFYEQAPEAMKSLFVALAMLCGSLGNYLNSLIVTAVELLTARGGRRGWLPEDLDDGHLDYFFWGMAVLAGFNFAVYVVLAKKYTTKKVVLGR